MIKWSIGQENMTVVNVYEPNAGYLKQMLMKLNGNLGFNTKMVGEFNTSL